MPKYIVDVAYSQVRTIVIDHALTEGIAIERAREIVEGWTNVRAAIPIAITEAGTTKRKELKA